MTSASRLELKQACGAKDEAEFVSLAVVNQAINHFSPSVIIVSRLPIYRDSKQLCTCIYGT